MATGDSPPRIPPRDRRETRRGGIPHVQGRQQNPDPAEGSREAGSSKSTAGHPAGMLRESGRQQPVRLTWAVVLVLIDLSCGLFSSICPFLRVAGLFT